MSAEEAMYGIQYIQTLSIVGIVSVRVLIGTGLIQYNCTQDKEGLGLVWYDTWGVYGTLYMVHHGMSV